MDDKIKKVNKFGLWLVVVFAAIFAAVTTFLYMLVQPLAGGPGFAAVGMALARGWLIYLLAAVILIAVYFIYRLLVLRKK